MPTKHYRKSTREGKMAKPAKKEDTPKEFDLWEWLLEKGLLISGLVINLVSAIILTLAMLFVAWFTKDH